MTDLRDPIAQSIQSLATKPLRDHAIEFLKTLGYQSDRTVDLGSSKPDAFLDFVKQNSADGVFNSTKALFDDWKSADLLFQLTDNELSPQASLFNENDIAPSLLRSYLFFAIELTGDNYARGKLTDIARQINRVFPMPVMVLIKHKTAKQSVLSVAVINRRQNKIDASKDVLGKVTIIRDISIDDPHRGHLDILASFALETLREQSREPIETFDALHAAWEEIFNVELLNQRFYQELANWYFWALPQVEFPDDVEKDKEKRNATSLIRLLTRLIFCWFLKEKGLIPGSLFDSHDLKKLLVDLDDDSHTFHQGILQNLFFGTLNQQMGNNPKTKKPYRQFAKDEGFKKNRSTYDVNNLYRYEALFNDPEQAVAQFADIPFLNGGLFECLDRSEEKTNKKLYIDGFSRNHKKRPKVPNHLFFSEPISGVDLSDAYGVRSRRNETVRGLIRILNGYKFTIVENTPIDQEIALDPELLGKVFENLLASYNEETKTTARKQTGSFYTPRPIVEYMVDESLKAHLRTALIASGMKEQAAIDGLQTLFAYTEQPHPFDESQVDTLLEAIHTCKILDPACGSGAFPMGMLQKLVYIIHRLDPGNEKWMQLQIERVSENSNAAERKTQIAAIVKDFQDNAHDYARKLYLIENCLYGVDIQPIAIQISKLRFFISLICDQRTNRDKSKNHGVRPLPNLETKFVAADTLISLRTDKKQLQFKDGKIASLESELRNIRHEHFAATTRKRKQALQRRDREIRRDMAIDLEQTAFWDQETALKLAKWDPYDPQGSASFFEPLWMFDRSLEDGFDVVIGNPPYIQIQKFPAAQKAIWVAQQFATYAATADIYCLFYERGASLLKKEGRLSYITSNKWMRTGYGDKLRRYLSTTVDTQEVLDFGMAQNFGAATTYTCVVNASNQESRSHTLSCYATDDRAAITNPENYFRSNHVAQTHLDESPWVVISKARQRIKQVVEQDGIELQSWDVDINYGVKTGCNDAFYVSSETRQTLINEDSRCEEFLVPLIRGRNIERYRITWPGDWMISTFPARNINENELPTPLHDHLSGFKTKLTPKPRGYAKPGWPGRKTGAYEWYETQDSISYHRDFYNPKILYQDIAQSLPFFLDVEHHYFFNNTVWMLTGKSVAQLAYLTAFFNSSVFRSCFRDNFPEYSGNAYRLFSIFMEKIPVRRQHSDLDAYFLPLVLITQLGKKIEHFAASFLEDLIDACVMECYFREHMAERDLLFLDDLAPHLAKYDASASETKQTEFLEHLVGMLNAPESPIRNRLLRLTADSPDLLAVIKEEGRV